MYEVNGYPIIATWKGRPIEELSKEELIKALEWCAQEINRLLKQNEHDRNFIMDTFCKRV